MKFKKIINPFFSNPRYRFVWGIPPLVGLILGGFWYYRTTEKAIQYDKTFQLLKSACQDSAGKEPKAHEAISEYVGAVCRCFAKTTLKHQNVPLSNIISDESLVHAILKDCARRVPAAKE